MPATWRACSGLHLARTIKDSSIEAVAKAGIFINWQRETIVDNNWLSFSATNINKVSGGGSSISFNNLLPSFPADISFFRFIS